MSKVTAFAIDGLMTDPGPFSAAPDSALVEAQNVVLERRGLLEPRGGLLHRGADAVLKAGGYAIQHGHVTPVLHPEMHWALSGSTWIMRADTVTTVTGATSFTKGRLHSALMRGRLLFTSENGVCEVPPNIGTSTVAYRAGLMAPSMPWGYVSTGGSAGTWLATAQSVAYRFTLARQRADGTWMESAPTAPFIVRNTSGSAGGVTFIPLPGLTYTPWSVGSSFDALQTGDVMRVYRAPLLTAATGTPSDVMRLRAVLTITAGVVQTFTDALGDSDWNGPFLYTNATQEGILQARARPAYSRDMCSYNGMMLYAGFKRPQRVTLTCKAVGDISADPQEALCTKTINVTTTAATVNLTAISATDIKYLAVGQWITLTTNTPGTADARFQIDTQIATVNVGAGTATITKTANVSGAVNVIVWDWVGVTVGGTTYRQYAQEGSNTAIQDNLWLQAHNATGVRMGGYADLEYKFNNAASRIPDILLHASGSDDVGGRPEFRNVLMVFERASMSTATFAVKSTKPRAFNASVDSVTGVTSTMDGGDARLGVSVNDIPDAVPELNYIDIGDLSSPIYRVMAAGSSALVLKGDGVYNVFGSSKDSLTVQLIDATVRPPPADIAANWICARGRTVYAMTARGPMAITEGGATPFGSAIFETLRERFGPNFEEAANFTSCSAVAPAGWPYVLFSVQDASGATVYAYNTDTNAWTTWTTRRPVSAMWENASNAAFGATYVNSVYYDRRVSMGLVPTTATWPLTGDRWIAETCTINSVTPLGSNRYTIVIAAGSEWTPQVGDVMRKGAVLGWVDTVTNATTFTVGALSAPTTGPGAAWEESYAVRLIWTARVLAALAAEQNNLSVQFGFALRQAMFGLFGYFQSMYAPAEVQAVVQPQITQAYAAGSTDLNAVPELMSTTFPPEVSLDWGPRVGFTIQQARSWFSLGAVTIDAEQSTARTGRFRA